MADDKKNKGEQFDTLLNNEILVDDVSFLVRRAHPGLTGTEVEDPTLQFIPDELRAAAAYRTRLLSLAYPVFYELILSEKLAAEAEAERKLFFHHPDAIADFDYYGKAACWSLDECVALSFGKEPQKVNLELISPYVKVSPFALRYERRHDLFLRAKRVEQISDPAEPAAFLGWAKRNDIDMPQGLVERVRSVGIDTKELSTTQRENLLKLVYVMAVRHYKYDPTRSKNSTAPAIKSDLELEGLTLSSDTILSYLKEAAALKRNKWS